MTKPKHLGNVREIKKGKFEVVLQLSHEWTPFGLNELAGIIRGNDGYVYSFTAGVC